MRHSRDIGQFEQRILELAFETDVTLTTASVAYYLGIPSQRANLVLDELIEKGVLEIESDGQGNLYYFVPNARTHANKIEAVDSEAPAEPAGERPKLEDGHPPETSTDAQVEQHSESESSTGEVSSAPNTAKRPVDRASVTATNESGPVIQDAARCESRPLKNQKPVLASCTENSSDPSENSSLTEADTGSQPRAQQLGHTESEPDPVYWPAQQNRRPGLATRQGALAGHYDRDYHPGISMLLSLVLCGTGQIYNGEVSKGIMMMILCFLMWFVLLGWVIHIWAIIDSVIVAERYSRQANP